MLNIEICDEFLTLEQMAHLATIASRGLTQVLLNLGDMAILRYGDVTNAPEQCGGSVTW